MNYYYKKGIHFLEWMPFHLLLRGFAKLGSKPMILSFANYEKETFNPAETQPLSKTLFSGWLFVLSSQLFNYSLFLFVSR